MYLKSLTALGFKSFAEKTVLNFEPGITAIVGPNGCGKSNVADAIRWVLGEQSAKALRGGEMADVIFNGTDTRDPMSMAEVSITIGDVDEEHLQAAGVELSYNEVTLTRRVFRDGGSEYFINKTRCRLKDVQRLFMGTGVGRSSYSIMAQGNITQILSSKPDDRRMIFEEAAGITKFKSQKREALRKLDYTEQNLLRVADTIREVKRQLGSLQRQAGKARRYKELSTELQELDCSLSQYRVAELDERITADEQQDESIRIEIEENSAEVLTLEEALKAMRTRVSEVDQQISECQTEGLRLSGLCDQQEDRVRYSERRIQELSEQRQRADEDILQAEERRTQAEHDVEQLAQQLQASEATLNEHRDKVRERVQGVDEIDLQLGERRQRLREGQSELFSAEQELGRLKSELNALEMRKQGNDARLEKLSAEKAELEQERVALSERLTQFETNFESDKADAESQRELLKGFQSKVAEFETILRDIETERDGLLRQQSECRSRLNLLEQLESDREGFSEGASAALARKDLVVGSIAEHLQTPDEHVTAVESVLGHHLQAALTSRGEDAIQVLEDLRSQRKGRASIAATELEAMIDTPPAPSGEGPGLLASSVVTSSPSFERLIRRVLNGTRIVGSLGEALQGFRQMPGKWDYVTANGELLSKHGVLTGGGSGENSGSSSILGRKNQLAELTQSLAKINDSVSDIEQRRENVLAERTAAQNAFHQAQQALRGKEVEIASREGEFRALQSAQETMGRKIEAVVYEVQRLSEQEREGKLKGDQLSQQIEVAEAEYGESKAKIGALETSLAELNEKRQSATEELTEAKVALASREQAFEGIERQIDPLNQRIGELKMLAESRRRELGEFETRKGEAQTEIDEAKSKIESASHEREQVSQRATSLGQDKAALVEALDGRESGLKEVRSKLEKAQELRSSVEVRLAEQRIKRENLIDQIQQRYGLVFDEVEPLYLWAFSNDSGLVTVEKLTPEEMTERALATDWALVSDRVDFLRDKVDSMGPVNLVAIEEYEETEERFQFLTAQHDDLAEAKEQLVEVINKINTQTREMFVTTFEQIKSNFQTMFVEIFGGGLADLSLIAEEDVLESGIEIMARPPGKKLQSISLLSGGEQTMTAVALLFAIYQVRPSPFCVLDELDAPLDESNINRFITILQRFLTDSQFVIITHNKRTISVADVIYGVTMERRGVSKIVSVKFEDEKRRHGASVELEEAADDGRAVSGERVASIAESVAGH